MAKTICVIQLWEYEVLSTGCPLDCSNHRHVSRLEAMEMTARGESIYNSASHHWVGAKAICMTDKAEWEVRQSGECGPLVMQMQTS